MAKVVMAETRMSAVESNRAPIFDVILSARAISPSAMSLIRHATSSQRNGGSLAAIARNNRTGAESNRKSEIRFGRFLTIQACSPWGDFFIAFLAGFNVRSEELDEVHS